MGRRRSQIAALTGAVVVAGTLTLTSASGASHRPPTAPRATRSSTLRPPLRLPSSWKLVLNSTFSGRSLDTSIWRTGWFGSGITGPINQHELACYSSSNVTLPGNGALNLNLTRKPSSCEGSTRPYTGAIISTNPDDGRESGGFQYRYGVFEALIYVPSAGGMVADWATVMTLGQSWPRDGEDDIFEALNGVACFHSHNLKYRSTGLGGCRPHVKPGWHRLVVNWTPKSLTWYYDGVQVGSTTRAVTTAPMYIAVVNSVNIRSIRAVRPDVMLVKYVRVWQPTGPLARRAGYTHSPIAAS